MTALRTHPDGSPGIREWKELLSLLEQRILPALFDQIIRVLPKPDSTNGVLLATLEKVLGKVITENNASPHFLERTRQFLDNR